MEVNTGFWYFVSFALFVSAAAGPVKKIITEALNKKADDISKDLREANLLRNEAAALLAEAKQYESDAKQNAQAIQERAKTEASRIREASMKDLSEFVQQQKSHIEGRIKQLEHLAVQEIHDQMIEVAVEASHEILKKNMTPEKDHSFSEHELKKVKHLA